MKNLRVFFLAMALIALAFPLFPGNFPNKKELLRFVDMRFLSLIFVSLAVYVDIRTRRIPPDSADRPAKTRSTITLLAFFAIAFILFLSYIRSMALFRIQYEDDYVLAAFQAIMLFIVAIAMLVLREALLRTMRTAETPVSPPSGGRARVVRARPRTAKTPVSPPSGGIDSNIAKNAGALDREDGSDAPRNRAGRELRRKTEAIRSSRGEGDGP